MKTKPVRFVIKKKPLPNIVSDKANVADEKVHEVFYGQVRGLKASIAEERCARSLDKRGIEYLFRYGTEGGRGAPGWKEIDFLITKFGLHYPVNLNESSFVHRGTQAHDKLNEIMIMDYLNRAGYNPQPFQEWENTNFDTQDMSDHFIQHMLG